MKISIRHGGYGCVADYVSVLNSIQKDYSVPVTVTFSEGERGTATAIEVDFGDSPYQVDTEENVARKVRECLRRVDLPGFR